MSERRSDPGTGVVDILEGFKNRGRPFDARWRFFHGLRHPKRVLDLGCGRGSNGMALRRIHPSAEIYGVDLLQESEVSEEIRYERIDLDAATLPYPDGYFDAVVFTHVIEHLSRPLDLGREIERVLRVGGAIYLETPNWTTMLVPSLGISREESGPLNFFDDPTHIRPWSKHGLFEYLREACRLEVCWVSTRRSWPRVPLDGIRLIWGLIARRRRVAIGAFWNLFGWSIYGIAVKR